MKTVKKILITLIILLGIICLFQSNVKAANATISVSNNNPKPGEKVTVTAKVTAGAWNLKLSGNGKNETIYGYTNKNGNESASKSITFTAGKEGEKYNFSLNGDMTDISADTAQNVSKTTSITVAKNTTISNNSNSSSTNTTDDSSNKSSSNSNNSKKNEPTFKNVNQTVIVTEKVNFRSSYSTTSSTIGKITKGETVKRIGIGNNGWSKIEYNGKTGYIKTDYLSITSEDTEEKEIENGEPPFGLESLKIKGLELKPEFSTDIYNYTIETTEEIKELDIEKAIANNEDAKVEITGNAKFKLGDNIVKINVSDDKGNSAIYQITVKISEKQNLQQQNAEKLDTSVFNNETDRIQKDLKIRAWAIRGIIIFVTIIIIIMIILRYRTLKTEHIEKDYSKKDGYVIIDEKFDSTEKDKETIAKIEQFDEELEKNKVKEIEAPVQPRRMKKTKGKHF